MVRTHNLECGYNHIVTELLSRKTKGSSTFILNVYSSPSNHRQQFHSLFRQAVILDGSAPFIIAGDFNAPYEEWGYGFTTLKGKRLWQSIQEQLTVKTDPHAHTRIGKNTQRDTTPGLTITKNAPGATWHNTIDDLGSDHRILETHVPFNDSDRITTTCNTRSLVDWD